MDNFLKNLLDDPEKKQAMVRLGYLSEDDGLMSNSIPNLQIENNPDDLNSLMSNQESPSVMPPSFIDSLKKEGVDLSTDYNKPQIIKPKIKQPLSDTPSYEELKKLENNPIYKENLPLNEQTSEPFQENDKQSLGSEYANVQKNSSMAELTNRLAAAGELMGSSIAGAKPIAQDLLSKQVEDSKGIEKNYLNALTLRFKDPNSEESRNARNIIKGQFPELNLPDNVSAEHLKELLPTYLKMKEMEEQRKARAETSRENRLDRMAMFKISEANKKALADSSLEYKKEKDAKITPAQQKVLSGIENSLSSIEKIESEKSKIDTGPFANARNWLAKIPGWDDKKVSAFKSEVNRNLAEYIHSISGTAASDKERPFLMDNLPNMSDNDDTFMSKLKSFKEGLNRIKENELMTLEKSGKNVQNFKSSGSSDTNELITVQATPNGKPQQILKSKLEEARKLAPDLKVLK